MNSKTLNDQQPFGLLHHFILGSAAEQNLLQAYLESSDVKQNDVRRLLPLIEESQANHEQQAYKKYLLQLAETLNIAPTLLWPEWDVQSILETIAHFQEDQELTATEATALRIALTQPAASIHGKPLPTRPRR